MNRHIPLAAALLALLSGLLYAGNATATDAGAEPILTTRTAGGGTGTVIWEKTPRADGHLHIDTPAMIEKAKRLGANHYTYSIWQSPKDWDDFRLEFAPAAQAAGLKLWVYLVPPSECLNQDRPLHQRGRCSHPYRTDYKAWARAIATLAVQYPNITGWAVDDFLVSQADRALFTPEYLAEVRAEQDRIKPGLEIYAVLYHHQIMDDASLDRIQSLDGVIYPYLGYGSSTIDPTWLEPRLDQALSKLGPRGLKLMLLIYSSRILAGSAVNHPQGDYLQEVLRRAKPYLLDGRLSGAMSYGTPVRHDLHQPAFDYWARHGAGRLSLSTNGATTSGSHADASQTVAVDGGVPRRQVTFHHRDQYEATGRTRGYLFKQLLVDGTPVWEHDVARDPRDRWQRETVDLTAALAGKTSARLTFRLLSRQGVGNYPVDVGVDDVSGVGLSVANGGFDRPGSWQLGHTHPNLYALADIYAADRPIEIFNGIGAGFAGIQGKAWTPLPRRTFPDLILSPENRAMYGNGRLEFSIPAGAQVPAGRCAAATQDVVVRPGLPRYQLSYWHSDTSMGRWGDKLYKEIWIDDQLVREFDVDDRQWWFLINGWGQQGPVDVTELVKGKSSVKVAFKACTRAPIPAGEFPEGVEIQFDTVETLGLDLRNGEFDSPANWHLQTAPDLQAAVKVVHS